ncbi:hypothetical protein [Streptomyces phaeochromogenes]
MNHLPLPQLLPRASGRVTVRQAVASTGHSPVGTEGGGGPGILENGTVA